MQKLKRMRASSRRQQGAVDLPATLIGVAMLAGLGLAVLAIMGNEWVARFELAVAFALVLTLFGVVGLRLLSANLADRSRMLAELESELDGAERSLADFQPMIAGANACVLRIDAHGVIRFANHFASDLFGFHAEELVGRAMIGSVLAPTDHDGRDHKQLLDDILRDPSPYQAIELESTRSDGSRAWVMWTFGRQQSLDATDTSAANVELIAIGVDTTLHRRAESLVLTQNRILSEVARGSSIGFVLQSVCKLVRYRIQNTVCTIHTRIHAPQQEREIIGVDAPNELLNALVDWEFDSQHWAAAKTHPIMLPANAVGASAELSEAIDYLGYQHLWLMPFGKNQFEGVIAIWIAENERQPDSRELEVLQSAESICSISAERDDSDRQLNEARLTAEAVAEAKSSFLARMSHEIRTPMSGVIGVLSLLKDRSDIPSEPRQQVTMAYNSSESLLALLDDILDISKIQAGKLQIESVPFDLRETLEDIVDLFAQRAFGKGVELGAAISGAIPDRIIGDPLRLRQVIANLVSNAVKFTETGHIFVRAYLISQPGQRIRFEVTDTGIGMSSDEQANIFESYGQANSSTSRKFGGTGLGLPLTRELVERLGGELSVQSDSHQGSTFSFELPFEADDSAAPSASDTFDCGPVHIVGAEGPLADSLFSMLRHRGADFDSASSLAGLPDTIEANSIIILIPPAPADNAQVAAEVDVFAKFVSTHTARGIVLTSPTTALELPANLERLNRPIRRELLARQLRCDSSDAPYTATAPENPASTTESDNEAAGTPSNKPNLLLVEDQDVNRLVARGLLKRLGLTATEVDNGAKAVEAVRNKQFDLVLMDCEMPIMDGYQATTAIRDMEKTTGKHVPIVALTAHALPEHKARCLAVGMDDYLSKPYKLADLEGMLTKWVPQDQTNGDHDSVTNAPESGSAATTDADSDSGASPSTAPESVIVRDEFADIHATFGDDIRDLVDSFADVVPTKLKLIGEAIKADDADALRREAHAFKGIANTVAARPVGAIAKELEDLGRSGTTQGAQAACERLKTLAERACNELRALTNSD